jgi:circadian clock protein KaiC
MPILNEAQQIAHGKPISKVPTSITGLDDILLGGLPQGRTAVFSGGPGTGKTVLGLEFLYRGALAGEPGIFVTFEESADAIRRNAQALGWSIQALEDAGQLAVVQADLPVSLIFSGEFNIGGLLAILSGYSQALGARRIVIDAIDVLLRLFDDPVQQRNQLYALHHWLIEQGLTVVITTKDTDREGKLNDFLDYLADCVVRLDQRVGDQVVTRRLRVIKYRGSAFLSNEYPYVISANGIELMPVSTVHLQHQRLGPPISTGNGRLDELLGGGFRHAACILIGGFSGTGKTTLACTFAAAACERGERVIYISFEESAEALVSTMLSPSIDLQPALEAQQLVILTVMPESTGAEEHLLRIFQSIDSFQPDHLIVDAISACRRMGSERAAFDFLVRLTNTCKAKGITCIYTNQTGSSSSIEEISGIGISSLVDAMLLLEQRWVRDSYERRLLIIKARGSKHSHAFQPFTIDDDGIKFGEPLSGTLWPEASS